MIIVSAKHGWQLTLVMQYYTNNNTTTTTPLFADLVIEIKRNSWEYWGKNTNIAVQAEH